MDLKREELYQALISRDSRFDGRFFAGISTTGIYCRPICPARKPKLKNCTFFSTAAAAEKEGYRPCLRCCPEKAPGLSPAERPQSLLQEALKKIHSGDFFESGIKELAESIGITERHLRRIFKEELGLSPLEYITTQKLLLAKQLLQETQMSILDISLASGFGSLSQFNSTFKKQYSNPPSTLRKNKTQTKSETIQLTLSYIPPYNWEALIGFIQNRLMPGVEHIENSSYYRVIEIEKGGERIIGWINVQNFSEKNCLKVVFSEHLIPVLSQAIAKVKSFFDLNSNPYLVAKSIQDLTSSYTGLRSPGTFNSFEVAVRTILGQQISVKGASTISDRLLNKISRPFKTDFSYLRRLFPLPKTIAACSIPEICQLGVTQKRAETIITLAKKVASGELSLNFDSPLEQTRENLLSIPGIGPWTADYICMRCLGDTNSFLSSDLFVKKYFSDLKPKEIENISKKWSPWRSYALLQIWQNQEKKNDLL